MKKLLLFAALATLALTSCQKDNKSGSASSMPVAVESYKALNIISGGQTVKMKVTGNQLDMVYNEDVTLLLDSTTLAKSWSVHLKEDLGSTKLSSYEYHSITKWGINATNWVDDNISNMVIKSSKDTLLNNHLFVKKRITRTFNYQHTYDTATTAQSTMDGLLKQTDILTFSAYYAPENPSIATVNNTAKMTYVKM